MNLLLIVRILEVATILLGMLVVYTSYKAYIRLKAAPLLYLGSGFLLLTIGSVAEGVLYEIVGVDLLKSHLVESFFELAGFLLVIYSIYSQ